MSTDPLQDSTGLIGTVISFNARPLPIPATVTDDFQNVSGKAIPPSVPLDTPFVMHLHLFNPNGASAYPNTLPVPITVDVPLYPPTTDDPEGETLIPFGLSGVSNSNPASAGALPCGGKQSVIQTSRFSTRWCPRAGHATST